MKNLTGILLAFCISLSSAFVFADSSAKLTKRSEMAASALIAVVNAPDKAIPISLLKKSYCIATIPNVVRAGFIFGVRGGKGIVSCRTNAGWSDPSYVSISGGSWGIQIGVDSTDLIFVFAKANAVARLSQTNFTLGGDASVAAGPVGRNAEAGTDYQLNSEIYAYSRSRGLFAGLTIEGALLKVENGDNQVAYGSVVQAKDLLVTNSISAPQMMWPYLKALESTVPTP